MAGRSVPAHYTTLREADGRVLGLLFDLRATVRRREFSAPEAIPARSFGAAAITATVSAGKANEKPLIPRQKRVLPRQWQTLPLANQHRTPGA